MIISREVNYEIVISRDGNFEMLISGSVNFEMIISIDGNFEMVILQFQRTIFFFNPPPYLGLAHNFKE